MDSRAKMSKPKVNFSNSAKAPKMKFLKSGTMTKKNCFTTTAETLG
jgi:hypothetical protein